MQESKKNTLLNIPPQVVQGAVETGLKMLRSEDVATPNAWNTPLANLEGILVELSVGNLVLATPPPGDNDGAGDGDD